MWTTNHRQEQIKEGRARMAAESRHSPRRERSAAVGVNGRVIGLDEVGMGALAGPLVVVAILFEGQRPRSLDEVTDSKKLTAKKREHLAPLIAEAAITIGVGWAMPEDIDAFGMAWAWQNACSMALSEMPEDAQLLVDGTRKVAPYNGPQKTVVKGDIKHWQIGAASVVAKVIRDQDMAQLGEHYPGYCWDKNSGYGTKVHTECLKAEGPSPWHRMSFLKKIL